MAAPEVAKWRKKTKLPLHPCVSDPSVNTRSNNNINRKGERQIGHVRESARLGFGYDPSES